MTRTRNKSTGKSKNKGKKATPLLSKKKTQARVRKKLPVTSVRTLSAARLGYVAALKMQRLSLSERNQALEELSRLLDSESCALQDRNEEDMIRGKKEKLAPPLMSRLHLDSPKLFGLRNGIKDLISLPDPVGKILKRTQLDQGLILEQKSAPLGLIAVVFESRPDVIPQILSLILKSGNAVILKGGKEAYRTNQTFEELVGKLNAAMPFLPKNWAQFVHSREEFTDLLQETEYVSLVIPRGSNQLVQAIMKSTTIPVLGHADGVCHLYVHPSADLVRAIPLILESKVQSPSACNALETLLIDENVSSEWLLEIAEVLVASDVKLFGCEKTKALFRASGIAVESVGDWHHEYSSKSLSIKIVASREEAIAHINAFGSHHTDGVLASDLQVIADFKSQLDSACVFVNCSTRFSDGYRFGLGAEVGISTSKIHARGPVGMEGLLTTKWELSGDYHQISPYLGEGGKRFQHRDILK